MTYNYNYGTLKDQTITYAPKNVEKKGTWYCPAPASLLVELGYKKITKSPKPTDGQTYTETWEQTSTDIYNVWTVVPEPTPVDPTPAEQRETAYETLKICEYGNGLYTVDEMNKLWYEYSAEGDTETVAAITVIIADAKAKIRAQYPDE